MKYQLGSLLLDIKARTLSGYPDGESKKIRPKTLELLLYLASRKGQLITKKELLAEVWHDVHVDEGVIFQSIAEIRKLVPNPDIILNYPRRGYEFTEELVKIESPISQHLKEKNYLSLVLISLCVVIVLSVSFVYFKHGQQQSAFVHHIAILPVKNHVVYAKPNWVSLSGMEQLIARLQGLSPSVFVYQSTDIPRFMHQAGMGESYDSEDVAKLFTVSGASLVVETDIYGGAYNYNLVYKFHLKQDVKQGSIFDTSIEGALSQLSLKVADFIAHPLGESDNQPHEEFSDALFAQAIISYESDWKTSISFFESYLALNPDSIMARLYLSRLYLWQERIDEADSVITKVVGLDTDNIRLQAFTLFVQGQVAAAKQQLSEAIAFYDEAQKILKDHADWSLKADIYAHRAHAFERQDILDKGIESYEKALSYYEIIQNPIGINSTRLHLARLLSKQGQQKASENHFQSAKEAIENDELVFLYTLLAEQEKGIATKYK